MMQVIISLTDRFLPQGCVVFRHSARCCFFVRIWLAFFVFSGIITTNLGKTATHTKNRRARKDGYITPKYALLLYRRGAFFLLMIYQDIVVKY